MSALTTLDGSGRGYVPNQVGAFSTIADARSLTWQDDGKCRAKPLDMFYPVGNKYTKAEREARAKAVCNSGCPVKQQCLAWALETHSRTGVWGGLSEEERRPLHTTSPRSPVRY